MEIILVIYHTMIDKTLVDKFLPRIMPFLILSIPLALIACTSEQPDCLIADSIKPLDSIIYNEAEYSLVLKTSGWSDKVIFIELYKGVPEFDICGVPYSEPIFSEIIDEIKSNTVIIQDDKLLFAEPNIEREVTHEGIRFKKQE